MDTKQMKSKVEAYIAKHNLLNSNHRVLVGISGGRDSVSLAIILKQLGYKIALAHCNFSLRADESDADEQFVLDFAKKQNLEVFNICFDTQDYADKKGISIQMAARELRYNWFEKIRTEKNYDCIAIGHNRDDIIETFFINMIRGTGLDGLSGIKPKNNTIIRPLLDISRDSIDQFIQKNKLAYREDSSNASTKYIRNKLRHHIIPEFQSISKGFEKTMIDNIDRIKQSNTIYKNEIEFKKSKLFIELSDKTKINIERLKQLDPLQTYLYEFLKPYGFSLSTVKDIILTLDAESGKQFFSKTHQIIKDREELILNQITKTEQKEIFFGKETTEITVPIALSVKIVENKNFNIPKSNRVAVLDLEKLSFPLLIRNWKHGDFFMPLGMNRMKKLSDFFIDAKLSIAEKEESYLIQSKNDIVWLVGQRIDDRYKVSEQTKNILIIRLLE